MQVEDELELVYKRICSFGPEELGRILAQLDMPLLLGLEGVAFEVWDYYLHNSDEQKMVRYKCFEEV